MSEPLSAVPGGDRACRCVKRHNPLPDELHRHHVWPLSEDGPDVADNLLWLCPTMHQNVHRLWREYIEYQGNVPWKVRRAFSAYCRSVVARGWAQAHTRSPKGELT